MQIAAQVAIARLPANFGWADEHRMNACHSAGLSAREYI
jgi:hypothetical protein